MPTTDEPPSSEHTEEAAPADVAADAPTDGHAAEEPAVVDGGGRRPRGWLRTARRYGPFAAVAVLALAAVVVFRGDGDGDTAPGDGEVVTDHEALVRSGPMTPEKADLLGEEVDWGPGCDPETLRIMLPTVYAPPCVAPFDVDNGGATSPGVTEDAIKLVLYIPRDDFFVSMLTGQGTAFEPDATIQAVRHFVDLYNQTFETYGRRVELEVYTGRGAADDQAQAQADAREIAEMEPFAVVGGPFLANVPFADELAAQGVVCLPGCGGSGLPDSFVEERAPYVWVDGMTSSQTGRIAGDAIGAVAGPGEPAALAGDPELRDQERVYGVLYPEGGEEDMLPALREGLAQYDIEIAVDIAYSLDVSRVQEDTRNHIVRLRDAGVTTVIVTGAPFTPGFLTHEATEQGYSPEWILGPNYFADTALFGGQTDQEQWVNGFGIGYKLTSHTTAGQAPELYEWAYSDDAVDIPSAMPYIEPATRMLFTGIHLAGPELTPDTFRDGLFRFPPSGDGVTSAVVSWGDHDIWPDVDYGTEDDVSIIWWDPAAENPEAETPTLAGPGLYRLANAGQRYTPGQFPATREASGLHDEGSSVVMYAAPLPDDVEALFDRYAPPQPPG
jgi:hypothetical protein